MDVVYPFPCHNSELRQLGDNCQIWNSEGKHFYFKNPAYLEGKSGILGGNRLI